MSSSSSNSSNPHESSKKCFLEWMNLQEQELNELVEALDINDRKSENVLNQLKEKSIQHFQDYMEERQELAKSDVSSYFAPSWVSTLENSLLWIAGCRPSAFIRLLYALCGSEVETNLSEFVHVGVRADNLGGLSWKQLNLVNDLHRKTVKQEDTLTGQFALLQEDVADQPIAMIAKGEMVKVCRMNEELNRALDGHEKAMLNVLQEADKLRLSTLKELISILTPVQAVDYLASGKKLHLCLHGWGKRRDHMHGRDIGN